MERETLVWKGMRMEERSSGFVVYFMENKTPLYLLIRSSDDGYWGFPKGKIDPGENQEEAARRELAEETGITDYEEQQGFEKTTEYWYTRDENKIHKEVLYYLARVESREVKLSGEHSEHGWFASEEALKRLAFKNLRDILEKAHNIVSSA